MNEYSKNYQIKSHYICTYKLPPPTQHIKKIILLATTELMTFDIFTFPTSLYKIVLISGFITEFL